jgi:hypothetical protein
MKPGFTSSFVSQSVKDTRLKPSWLKEAVMTHGGFFSHRPLILGANQPHDV